MSASSIVRANATEKEKALRFHRLALHHRTKAVGLQNRIHARPSAALELLRLLESQSSYAKRSRGSSLHALATGTGADVTAAVGESGPHQIGHPPQDGNRPTRVVPDGREHPS